MTKLGSTRFLEKAKELVIDYFNKEAEKSDGFSIRSSIKMDDVYVV